MAAEEIQPLETASTSALQRVIKNPKSVASRNVVSATMARSVPAFLNKLYSMVTDSSTDEMIHWGPDGTTFLVEKCEDFARDVLPRFFKHNNFPSFQRQLNMYGFNKIPHLQQGVLLTNGEPEVWEFSNPNFQRNQPDLLCLVSRKKGRDVIHEDKEAPVDMNYVIQEIAAIKRHQLTISSDLKNIQRENQVLWSESVVARERHQRQQETIDKILNFLASIFSNKKKPLTNNSKRRRLLLDRARGDTEEQDEDDEDMETIDFSQRIQDLMQSPATSSTAPLVSPNALQLRSATNSSSNRKTTPNSLPAETIQDLDDGSDAEIPSQPTSTSYYQQPLITNDLQSNSPAIAQTTQSAANVADDIDLLQDHLHNFTSLVGLDPSFSDIADYDVGNFFTDASGPAMAGTPGSGASEENRKMLLALMGQYAADSGLGETQSTDPPTSSTTMDDGLQYGDSSMFNDGAQQPQRSAQQPLQPRRPRPQLTFPMPSDPSTSSLSSLPLLPDPTSTAADTLDPTPDGVSIDDLQNGLQAYSDDDLAGLLIPEHMSASDFDFLNHAPGAT